MLAGRPRIFGILARLRPFCHEQPAREYGQRQAKFRILWYGTIKLVCIRAGPGFDLFLQEVGWQGIIKSAALIVG